MTRDRLRRSARIDRCSCEDDERCEGSAHSGHPANALMAVDQDLYSADGAAAAARWKSIGRHGFS